MTSPLRSFDTNFGRFYAHPVSGVSTAIAFADQNPEHEGPYAPKPSITNIIGVMDEGFLPGFYAKQVAEHAIANLDSYRYQVDKFGSQIAVGALKAIPERPNPAAAIGDEVHSAIDVFCTTGEVAKPEDFSTSTARQMFAQFRNFFHVEKPEILASEFTVWSYKHGYAGTGDLMVRWRGDTWVWDTKTGKTVYPKVAMQCAAFKYADVIIDATGEELPIPHVDRIGAFHVRPRSAKLFELQHMREAFDAFLGLKACFDWRRFWKESTIPAQPLASTEHKFS